MKASVFVLPFLVAGLIGASAYAGNPPQVKSAKHKTTSQSSTSDKTKAAGKTMHHHGKHHTKKTATEATTPAK